MDTLLIRIRRRLKKLEGHVGGPNSAHNKHVKRLIICSIRSKAFKHHFKLIRSRSNGIWSLLYALVENILFLLRQRLAFCGHDESYNSRNQINFLEFLKALSNNCDDIKIVVLKNAPEN